MQHPFKEDFAKMQQMTIKKKAEYIWEYYKMPIICIIIGLIFVVSIAKSIAALNRDAITVIVSDISCEDSDIASRVLNDAFSAYLGDEADAKDMITLDASMYFSGTDDYTNAIMIQKMTALVASHSAHVILCDDTFVQSQGPLGMFEDLEEKLDPDTFQMLKTMDALVTTTIPADDEADEPTPEYTYYCGVDLSRLDNALLTEAGFTITEDHVLALPVNANNEERALAFFYMLLGDDFTK